MKQHSSFKSFLACISGLVLCAALSAYAGGGGGGAGGGGGGGGGAGGGAAGGAAGGGGGGRAGGARGGTPQGSQASVRVTAVPDDRANAVIVNASEETIKEIQDIINDLDVQMDEDLDYSVVKLTNADPTEISYQISQLFYSSSTSTTQAGRGGGGGMGGTGGGLASSSDRQRRLATVSTLPDPRTGNLIVAASKSLLPQVTKLIKELDSDPGRREIVGFFELQNADPQDAYTILSDLFNRSTVRMNSSANSSPLLGQNSPLTKRITASTSSTSSTFGSTSSTSGRTGTASTGF